MSDRIVIRWAQTEHVLRSTGEPAGILVLAFPEGRPSFAIDRAWEPGMGPPGATVVEDFDAGISPLAEAFDVADVVAACFSRLELEQLWLWTLQQFHVASQALFARQKFDEARALVDWAEEVAKAIDARAEGMVG